MEEIKVLLLEGERRPSHQTREELEAKGIRVTPVQDLAACLPILEAGGSHVVLLDLDLYRAGIEAVQKIHGMFPEIAVLVMASVERITVVDEALRQGAWDFVIKQPDLSHLQEIPQAISRSEERKKLKAEADRYREEAKRLLEESGRLQEEIERSQEEIKRLQAAEEQTRQSPGGPGDEKPKEEAIDDVLAGIAEDLKSPLAAMIGYLEIVSTISPDRAEPNQILSIQRIQALARRLFDLVMNHSGALDIEAGKFELQKNVFEINQILESAAQDKQGESSSKKIDIVLDKSNDLPPITADAVQIERALGILISNAINLSPLGGTVTVSSRLQGNEIAIAVKDSGAGIFKEEIPLLFDRRKKLHRRGADVSTVGLFVARHIVHAHGGRIDIQSDPHEGTTLTISLPV